MLVVVTLRSKSRVEAALVVLVPEADALVGPFRERYDPSALEGMLAHITINYPFQPMQSDRESLLEELADLFSSFPSTRFSLTELRQFPDTLYLAVEPERPFRELVEAVAEQYPESPSYGGVFDEVIPHVTVAERTMDGEFKDIAREFALASKGRLPIEGLADEVWLMDYEEGVWSKTVPFSLAR
jgi:2'-5' RNA ligase